MKSINDWSFDANGSPVDRPPMATRTWRTRLRAVFKRFIRWANTVQPL
ncbi:MAG TPA: hypothetical protein VFP95_06470 [Gammaproteobacteria bacterium]|nr:hypothetical protein [Gammaproteobacteria bacterium]